MDGHSVCQNQRILLSVDVEVFHDHKVAFDHFYVVQLGHVIKLKTDMAFSYCTYSADSTIHQTSAVVYFPAEHDSSANS